MASFLRPPELCAVGPDASQDHSYLARDGNLGLFLIVSQLELFSEILPALKGEGSERASHLAEVSDITHAEELIAGLPADHVLADKGYDLKALRETIVNQDAVPVIPPRKTSPQWPCDFALYCERNLVERFFLKIKHFRRIPHATTKHRGHSRIFLSCASSARSSGPKENDVNAIEHIPYFGLKTVWLQIRLQERDDRPEPFRRACRNLAEVPIARYGCERPHHNDCCVPSGRFVKAHILLIRRDFI